MPRKAKTANYDEKAAQRERMRKKRAAERDVVIPAVVDPARKESCKCDLVLYYETYFVPFLSLPPSPIHLEILRSVQDRILYGGSDAIAAPRGFGKDQLLIIAALWAITYGHCAYIAYFCPSMSMAKRRLAWLKFIVETNSLIAEDFPEVVVPVLALEGATQRGSTQTVGGERTRIKWSDDAIVFPSVPDSLSSLRVLQAGGLEGGNRGFNEMGLRPDFLIISDLESNEVARSVTQKEHFEETIEQSLGGLVGPGETLSMFMLCTIFMKDALSERYTDPAQKPEWNGKRYKALVTFPDRMDLWEKFMEIRHEGQTDGTDLQGRGAHAFYVKNKAEMDAGAEVLWKEWYVRKTYRDGSPMEISALESIFTKRCRHGEKFFWCELQNDPQDDKAKLQDLTPKLVSERLNGYPQSIVPANCAKLVAGIDVGKHEIHFSVWAFSPDGSPFCVDYGRVEVPRLLELDMDGTVEDIDKIQGDDARDKAIERRVLAALRHLRDEFRLSGYLDSDDNRREIDLVLVDSGGPKSFQDAVYKFTAESGRRYQSTKGEGSARDQTKFVAPDPNAKNRMVSTHWYKRPRKDRKGSLYHFDADFYKEYGHNRFLQEPGSIGGATLWGNDPKAHRLFGKHICAEEYDDEKGKWVVVGANHWLDTYVLALLASHLLGIRLRLDLVSAPPEPEGDNDAPKPKPKPKPNRQGRTNRSKVRAPSGQGRVIRPRRGAW